MTSWLWMMSRGRYCEQCFAMIARQSTSAARLWMDLCDLRLKHEGIFVIHRETRELTLLEQMRFVVTAEDLYKGTPRLVVGMAGAQLDNDFNISFCIGKDHD